MLAHKLSLAALGVSGLVLIAAVSIRRAIAANCTLTVIDNSAECTGTNTACTGCQTGTANNPPSCDSTSKVWSNPTIYSTDAGTGRVTSSPVNCYTSYACTGGSLWNYLQCTDNPWPNPDTCGGGPVPNLTCIDCSAGGGTKFPVPTFTGMSCNEGK